MLNTSIQKSFIIFSAFFLGLAQGVTESRADILEDFSHFEGSKFSDDHWKSRNGDPSKIYSFIKENNHTFLRAHADSGSVQLFRKKGWNLKENPVLSWKWRVLEFPSTSDSNKAKNDNAVGVYVVFPARWFMPETIKYIWNTELEKDRVLRKKDHFPAIVIRTGTNDKGKWILEERNVMEDYKKLFGRNAPNPVAFGFLTDSDDTKSNALGDYDDFRILPKFSEPEVVPVPVKPKK